MLVDLNLDKFTLVDGDEHQSKYEREITFNKYRGNRDKKVRHIISELNQSKKFKGKKKLNHKYDCKSGILTISLEFFAD